MSSDTKKQSILILLINLFIFTILICVDWVEIIDDAYIYFRYVYNIVGGNGYVYNIGETVEATTSLTWTLILSLANWLTISPELGVRILGYLCGLSILFLLWFEIRKLNLPSAIFFLLLLLFVTNRSFYASIMMGLETGLYSLMLVLVYFASGWFHKSSAYKILFGILALMLFLTRPEAIIIFVLIIGGIYLLEFDNKIGSIPFVVLIIAGILLTGILSYIVFNDFIPNSVRAKSISFQSFSSLYILLPRIVGGLYYIIIWLLSAPFLIIPALLGIKSIIKQTSFTMYVAISIIITGITVVLINSGDWMPYSRLLTPYLPIITILSGIAINRFLQSQKWLSLKQLNVFSTVSVFALIIFCLWTVWPISFFKSNRWPTGQCYTTAGKLLQPYLTKESLIAPEAIGAIGYILKDVNVLDFFGLTEPFIANNGTIPRARFNMGKHHYEYTMKKRPDLFFFHADLRNHIPNLNKWGYSKKYATFKLKKIRVS